ncbi:hypothetical protein NPIL_646591 [Nephila pilipes]|uniref:Uncharacterized protein n=1 Tax=Nephila pilipes TaxID=299642 RepID=A0A8X6QUU1_NEPPI|nr:hypothetical protein NPIL_646591 [Nephila pilipes]
MEAMITKGKEPRRASLSGHETLTWRKASGMNSFGEYLERIITGLRFLVDDDLPELSQIFPGICYFICNPSL